MHGSGEARLSLGGALAIFVKTPGFSPIKTRLAKGIGESAASSFYLQSVLATAANALELLRRNPNLQIYWAVAEREALGAELWKEFPTIHQGEGSLGERLSNIYQDLISRHHFVCFIGADSPQLTVSLLEEGVRRSAKGLKKKFVLGETEDGGFYFFGGSATVPEVLWTVVRYSSPETSKDLVGAFEKLFPFEFLSSEFDVDTKEDLAKLADRLGRMATLTSEQEKLLAWLGSEKVLQGPLGCV